MRISDWSSDVCSSDLRPRQLHIAAGRLNRPHRPHRVRRYGADMAGKKPGGRPLSPHLGLYKWAPSMAVSIFHRVSGDGLAIVGGLMFLWWPGALAAGPDAYAADRKSVGEGKSVSVRVDPGGRRVIKKKKI